jgi:16S rRNA processing protein RimM
LTSRAGQVTAGWVGRAHGLDGSFYVDHLSEPVELGAEVTVGDRTARVERRAGTADRPILRLSGVPDRTAAEGLRGQRILIDGGELSAGEYLTAELVGCEVPGIGIVRRVVTAPSCDLLEVGDDGVLVPFTSGAIRRVDTDARVIEVNADFLDLRRDGPPQ